jgi:hypothetical protein
VLKKVKEKVKKIKSTLAGHGHGHDGEHGGDERMGEEDAYAGSDSSEEGEEDAVEREAALEKDGYMEDIEDKPVVMESDPDPDPDVHGAPSKVLLPSDRRRHTCVFQDLCTYVSARPVCSVRVGEGSGRAGPRRRVRSAGVDAGRARGGGRRRLT